MPYVDTTVQQEETEQQWVPLETDQYVLEITEAQIAPSKFEDDKKPGQYPLELRIVWELAEWNEDYEAAGYEQGQRVYQHMRWFWGDTKEGVPSRSKQFILDLVNDGLIPPRPWIAGEGEAANQGDLIGVKRRATVEKYRKTKGVNAGQPGNRVVALAPLQRRPPAARPQPTPQQPRQPTTTASQGMTRISKADFGPMDDPAVAGEDETLPGGQTRQQALEYARTLAKQAGGRWEQRNFDVMPTDKLAASIRYMERFLESLNSDPSADLFPE